MLLRRAFITFVLATTFISASGQVLNYAAGWNAMGESGQFFFVMGYVGGLQQGRVAGTALFDQLVKESADNPKLASKIEAYRDVFERATSDKPGAPEILRTVTHMYTDPANRAFPWEAMCSLALMKLRGEDIEGILRLGRAAADKSEREREPAR